MFIHLSSVSASFFEKVISFNLLGPVQRNRETGLLHIWLKLSTVPPFFVFLFIFDLEVLIHWTVSRHFVNSIILWQVYSIEHFFSDSIILVIQRPKFYRFLFYGYSWLLISFGSNFKGRGLHLHQRPRVKVRLWTLQRPLGFDFVQPSRIDFSHLRKSQLAYWAKLIGIWSEYHICFESVSFLFICAGL